MTMIADAERESMMEYYPLTVAQKSIWYLEKLHPGTSIANIASTLKIKEHVDHRLLGKAINLVIAKNEALRLRFLEKDGVVLQYVAEYRERIIDYFDFSLSEVSQLYAWDHAETHKPFDLDDNSLVYFATIKISDNESAIYCKIHHLISDGWTVVYIGNKIMEYYNILKEGSAIDLAVDPSYLEYVSSEKDYCLSEKYLRDKDYWEGIFNDTPEMTSLKSKAKAHSTEAVRRTFKVPTKLSGKISQYCIENKTSVFILYISALCIYINRIANKGDIVLGAPVLNRSNAREKKTVGMFISTIPLRVNIDNEINFQEFNYKLTRDWMDILRHQKYPYDEVLKHVRKNNKHVDKLYEIAVSYQNAKFIKKSEIQSCEGRWHFCGHQTESLYIHINEREDDGNIIIDYDYLTDLFYSKEIEFIHDHVLRILWHALDNSAKKISHLEMISEREKQKILYDFNMTRVPLPVGKTVPQLFEEQVQKSPTKEALIFEGNSLSYQELNQRANRLARVLRKNGVGANTFVGVLVPRSFEMIIAILAILKAGGAYVPLDPTYPSHRINYMLMDSHTAVLLTQPKLVEDILFSGAVIDVFDPEFGVVMDTDTVSNLTVINEPEDTAYLIYTSGSTGNPKGVMVPHIAVINLIEGVTAKIDFAPDKKMLSITTVSFDIFFAESLLPLSQGLTVVIANEQEQIIPKELNRVLCQHDIKIFQATPSRAQLLLNSDIDTQGMRNLSDILVTGEAMSAAVLNRLKTVSPSAKIYDLYGPTETTIWSTMADVTHEIKPHIGKPIANTQIYILDQHLNLLPIGVPGDLYIGGAGVSKGYYGLNELTQERFITNPFKQGERIYKTGDIARWYPEGDIEYLGRSDFQVKIRGYRIELGEIEDKLLERPDIKEAVVVTKEKPDGNWALYAYYVSDSEIIGSELKQYLKQYLPDYMIPAYIIQINAIPKTPNNKTDRNALPEFEEKENTHVPARNTTEKTISEIWYTLLGRKSVGIDDNFFDLGGDSLSIVQLQVLLAEKGIDIGIQKLYDYSTIRQIADYTKVTKAYPERNDREISEDDISKKYTTAGIALNYDNDKGADNIKNILLTGATGFLGIHLLEKLLINKECDIFCLTRGKNMREAEERLYQRLNFYFHGKYNRELGKRIKIVLGDITQDKLGMDEQTYELLLNKTDLLIHSAAIVKHYGLFQDYLDVNIRGTERIVDFCLTGDIRLNYVSSISVSGNYLTDNLNHEPMDFTERDLYIGQDLEGNVYVRSKFEAENYIYQNVKRGLAADIYRIGVLTGRCCDGHFQNNIQENAFYERIKTIIDLRAIPELWLDQQIEFTPVDSCSDAFAKLVSVSPGTRVYHLYNHKTIRLSRLVDILENLGIKIEVVSIDVFLRRAEQSLQSNRISPVLYEFAKGNSYSGNATINVHSEITQDALSRKGFDWPEIDQEYIYQIVQYMKETGYLLNNLDKRDVVC